MKRTFIKMLPLAAAVILATSCSKDSNDDSNVAIDPVETQNVASPTESKTIPFSITVGKDTETLSKATLQDGTTTTQLFEKDDQLVLKNGETEVATLSLPADYTSSATATFSGDLTTEGLTSGTTTISVTLKNTTHNNPETALTGVQEATSLAEAFQKFGYWTSSFTYKKGETPTISLVQNTVFLKIKPYSDADNKATVNGKEYTAQTDGTIYLAVANGTAIASNLFYGVKTVTNDGGKVVKNIDRSAKKSNDVEENSLKGEFSVSSTRKVAFSKGNLRATTSDNCVTWTFCIATNQFDYIGNATANNKVNGNGTVSENGTVDLFGWVGAPSPWTGAAQYGVSSSTTINSTETYGDGTSASLKSDWGTLIGDGKTWRTLTTEEWQYLLGTSEDRNDKNGLGTITVEGDQQIFGLIILPDGYTDPEGVSQKFVSGTANTTYSASDWSAMETAGAVFLPAAGNRYGSSVDAAGSHGCYWSSSAWAAYARRMYFDSDKLEPATYGTRCRGYSVRLVRSL